MGKFLRSISDGDLFKKVFAIILRVAAVIVALGGLYLWIRLWGMVSDLDGFFAVVGGIIFQIILIITISMVTHVVWLRAAAVSELPSSDFTVIPIASMLLKLTGEIYVSLFVPLSIAGGIGLWFGGGNFMYYVVRYIDFLPQFPLSFMGGGGGTFLGGLFFMIGGIVMAFLSLVFFYLLAEILVVAVDIARNMNIIREISEGYKKPDTAV
jgi:hypothetical protein